MAPKWPDDPLPSDIPFSDLPITNDHCNNVSCIAFAEGFAQSQHETPLRHLLEYGHYTVYFYTSWILFFALIHLINSIDDHIVHRGGRSLRNRPAWSHKITATWRWLVYSQSTHKAALWIGLPTYGVTLGLSIGTIFFAILPFVEHPYLREYFRFGSPPLSVKCALIIAALTPLTVALAGKVNFVSIVTGISYAKLNIFHRFLGYILFALSTVHAIPHLYAPVKDGGWEYLNQLYRDRKQELSGTILYAVICGLTVLSLPWARRKAYEMFAYTHVFLAVTYMGIIFWHIHNEYMAPTYLYVTVGLYILSVLLRSTKHKYIQLLGRRCIDLSGFSTHVEHLAGRMSRVTVRVPITLRWSPGQHVYIRMPQLSVLGNHPFTILSIPVPLTSHRQNELVFLIRAHGGFTNSLHGHGDRVVETPTLHPSTTLEKNLQNETLPGPRSSLETNISTLSGPTAIESLERRRHQHTNRRPRLRTMVDGPYGGSTRPLHRIYDTIIAVTGGSGITAAIPWILHLSHLMRLAAAAQAGEEASRVPTYVTRTIRLVWVVRDQAWVEWIRKELQSAMENVTAARGWGRLEVWVYCTGPRSLGTDTTSSIPGLQVPGEVCVRSNKEDQMEMRTDGGQESTGAQSAKLHIIYARPKLAEVVTELADGQRTAVLACGSEPMKIDVSNAVARMQRRVWRGEMVECMLHAETFGW